MAFHKCRNNGCEIQIEVRNTAEGWRPYEESGNMHQCQHSEYAKKQRALEKNDHGNENNNGMTVTSALNEQKIKEVEERKQQVLKGDYKDHTLAGIPQMITIVGENSEEMDDLANSWLRLNNNHIKFRGGTRVYNDAGFEVTLWYEEKQ